MMKLNWLDENKIENPIRKHIQVIFKKVNDQDEIYQYIAEDLKLNFDSNKSSVLIFAQSRRKTEEASVFLNEIFESENEILKDKIDYFHAGLDAIQRDEKYQKFKKKELSILVATKAFGMGMDIKDIHYIYHLSPSFSFEDYLQEVGRAGRNKELMTIAGFGEDNPIKTICFYKNDDFGKMKDRIHQSMIVWDDLIKVQNAIYNYVSKFKNKLISEDFFPLPLDLLLEDDDFKDIKNKDTYFRVCLYWLEKLKRIKLGLYTPTHLPIEILDSKNHNFSQLNNLEIKEKIRRLYYYLEKEKHKQLSDSSKIMLSLEQLKDITEENNINKLYQILFSAQKCNVLCLVRILNSEPTKSKSDELESNLKKGLEKKLPIIESVFDFSKELIKISKLQDQTNLDDEDLNNLAKNSILEFITPDKIFWAKKKEKESICEKTIKEFKESRKKNALKILNFIDGLNYKSIIEINEADKTSKISHLLFNKEKKQSDKEKQIKELEEIKKDLYKLIAIISKGAFIRNNNQYNIVNLMLELDIQQQGEKYLQTLLHIAFLLGYLKSSGGLTPFGIELWIKNLDSIENVLPETDEKKVYDEFQETIKLKELRLSVLEGLSKLKSTTKQDEYIKLFFEAKTISDIINLLELNLGEDAIEILAMFREEELNKRKNELNEEQLAIYNEKINKNIQVIAGPGSGKTHTLILRVAKLIQEDKVNPENILILAYNRAVVIELKERLSKIFRQLGYAKIINRLKIFTFDGLIKFCINNEIDEDANFENNRRVFAERLTEVPGFILQKLGNIKYVFVDEFQDVDQERLDVLKTIVESNNARICVIGDPNQSIYGYQRDQKEQAMDAIFYYEKFNSIFKPIFHSLYKNYRSWPLILEKSTELVNLNKNPFRLDNFELKKIEAVHQPETIEQYCEIVSLKETKIDWADKLDEFLNYKDHTGKMYESIAIMFRSNNEVFRAYNILKSKKLPNKPQLRIQGAHLSLFKTREFFHFVDLFLKKTNQKIERNFVEIFIEEKNNILQKFPNWEIYYLDVLHCIILEFEKDFDEFKTYFDLVTFIKDITYFNDGQYGKIYEQNIKKIHNYIPQNIILTTMHKVKGIEYDAVIIPSSLTDLPMEFGNHIVPDDKLNDYLDEERRLYYVAYTRAKRRLFVLEYDRENALKNNQRNKFDENLIRKNYGLKFNEGIDKFILNWYANYGAHCFDFIKNNLRIGDNVNIIKEVNANGVFWYVRKNNMNIGQLSKSATKNLIDINEINNLCISSIQVYTLEDSLKYDEEHHKKYTEKWNLQSKQRGYIYVIDFSGYGKSL